MEKTREALEIESYDPPARFEDSMASQVSPATWARIRKARRAWEREQQTEQNIIDSIRLINERILKARKAKAPKRPRKKAS